MQDGRFATVRSRSMLYNIIHMEYYGCMGDRGIPTSFEWEKDCMLLLLEWEMQMG